MNLYLNNLTYGSNYFILFANSDSKAIEVSLQVPKQTTNYYKNIT